LAEKKIYSRMSLNLSKNNKGTANKFFKTTVSMPLSTEVDISEESSPVTVSDTFQEGNSIFPEQSNESCVTETPCTI
jgi:hypothetical protein